MLTYQTGTPPAVGVYACRVASLHAPGWMEDKFLMWHDGRWWYLGSDSQFRDEVYWIGPLQRKLPAKGERDAD